MENKIELKKLIRIDSVKGEWNSLNSIIMGEDHPAEGYIIDGENLEILDGAGFQYLIYLLQLEKERPELYKVVNINEKVRELLEAGGYRFVNKEK